MFIKLSNKKTWLGINLDKEDILKFWFKECTPQQWFKKDEAFDNLLEERFAVTV